MINIVKVISSNLEKGKRILKFLRLGKSDVQTANESLPYGLDSSPKKGLKAIYLNTGEKGKSVIIGHINTDQISKEGETRLFSDFNEIFLSKNGDIQLGGTTSSAVKHEQLQVNLNAQDALINAEFAKIATLFNTLGVPYIPITIQTNIESSKSLEVKMK